MNLLFSLCWLGEPWRVERNLEWLKYHRSIKEQLGFDRVVLVDNASDLDTLKLLNGTIYDAETNDLLHKVDDSDLVIYRFKEHLTRTGVWEYPYCWRGLNFAKTLFSGSFLNKIIFLDSDFYVLTDKLASYIKNLDSGWVSFFCHKYGFPEAAMNILCKDTFQKLIDFPIPSFTHYNNKHMEWLLPFTLVHRTEYHGGRQGEGRELQDPTHDYYGQWSPGCPIMQFNLRLK